MNNVIDLAAERRARGSPRASLGRLSAVPTGRADLQFPQPVSTIDVAKTHGTLGIAAALGLDEDILF